MSKKGSPPPYKHIDISEKLNTIDQVDVEEADPIVVPQKEGRNNLTIVNSYGLSQRS